MKLESFPGNAQSKPSEQLFESEYHNPEKEEIKHELNEFFFHEVITAKIVDSYENSMNSVGYDEDQMDMFREKILTLSPDERELLYAFPWELKQRALPAFLKKIKEGKETMDSMIEKIIDASKQQNRRIAYHASKENILPKQERINGKPVDTWVVYRKEKDHRDNDLPMAYYSYDYENLYRTKNPTYIYMVSAQEDEKSGHRKDGNNEWGRAPSLTIIERIDLKEVDETVKALVEEEMKKTINDLHVDGLAA